MTISPSKTQIQTPLGRTGAGCREIPFELVSRAESKLRKVPVTSGVCLPKGALFEAGEWLVEGAGGAHVAAHTEVLNRWSDGSVRWMLARFVAGRILPGRTSCMLLRPEKRAQHFAGATSLQWTADRLTLSIRQSQHAEEATLDLRPELINQQGQRLELNVDSVTTETASDVCCVFVAQVCVRELTFLQLQLRIEVWPGCGLVRVETRIRNSRKALHKGGLWDLGDPGSYFFKGLQLQIHSDQVGGGRLHWKAETTTPPRQCSTTDTLDILQQSSGSTDRKLAAEARGYRVRSSAGVFRGDHAEPIVGMATENAQVTVAVPEFWQQFPGSVQVDERGFCVGLFPLSAATDFELQGGEQKTQTVWVSTRAKNGDLSHLEWVYQPPRMVQSCAWIQNAGVLPWCPERRSIGEDADRYSNYIHEATQGEFSIEARREKIDEYGWRNFGDVPADHEQTHYKGTNTVVSHYNNQFDLIFGAIQNLVLSGDPRWFDLFEPLARHVMDIDIYHTSEDRACFNGGLFWHTDHYVDALTATHRTYSRHNATGRDDYGGGPSNEHNYTTGLLYYHFLTGSREAYESVISLAQWVINMDDGTKTVFGLLDSGDTGLASVTVFEDFHGPGRGVGNSINALLDAWILTRESQYIDKAEQLIHRAVHPLQNCAELHLADAEGHWSYTVCMTALGRYLTEKLEVGQRDGNYDYVRRTLENYGRWMAEHEKPCLSEPEKLDYPTEAWAAQEFRKANALRIAASCTDDLGAEKRMRSKADELSESAWQDLYAFNNQHLTARCLSILMTEGPRDVFHRTCQPEYMPPAKNQYELTDWEMFVPQKLRVKQILKHPVKAVLAVTRLFNPRRVAESITALRRQL